MSLGKAEFNLIFPRTKPVLRTGGADGFSNTVPQFLTQLNLLGHRKTSYLTSFPIRKSGAIYISRQEGLPGQGLMYQRAFYIILKIIRDCDELVAWSGTEGEHRER